jgi:hypothetical protein
MNDRRSTGLRTPARLLRCRCREVRWRRQPGTNRESPAPRRIRRPVRRRLRLSSARDFIVVRTEPRILGE